jgi:hypothetical protein
MASKKVQEKATEAVEPMSPEMLTELVEGTGMENPKVSQETPDPTATVSPKIQTGVLVAPKDLLLGAHRFTHAPHELKIGLMPAIPEGGYAVVSLHPSLAQRTRVRLANSVFFPEDEVVLVFDNYGLDSYFIHTGDPIATFVIVHE